MTYKTISWYFCAVTVYDFDRGLYINQMLPYYTHINCYNYFQPSKRFHEFLRSRGINSRLY